MSRTWIIAFDFSNLAVIALERGAELLNGLGGGRLLVTHVHSSTSAQLGPDGVSFRPGFAELEDDFISAARGNIASHLTGIAEKYPALELLVRLERGHPADTLHNLAEREGAEMIVCGSHGRRGFERFLMGSVAERVVRLANVPVLVVKGEAKAN